MIDSDRLRAFLQVIDAGTLTQAALRLHVTQPALSRTMHLLEEELGVELFERTGRGMSPTPEGLKLAQLARPLLDRLALLPHQIKKDEIEGPVTLAVTPSIGLSWVAQLIEDFVKTYPAAQLRTAAVLSGAMGSAIAQGRYDLGLLYSPHTTPQLITKELWQERTYFVSGRRGLFPNKSSIGLSEVLRAPLILPSFESGILALLEMEATKLDLTLKPALVIDGIQLALEMVRKGNYGFILTERALADIRAKGLRAIPIVRPSLMRSAQLAATESALARPVVRALFNHIESNSSLDATNRCL